MSSVLDVLAWAREPSGPPPAGPLDDLETTLASLAECNRALAQLVARFAARHQLAAPPLGSAGLDSSGPLLLARVLAAAWDPRGARILLSWVHPPPSTTPLEALARHVLVAPALPFLQVDLADDLRAASPLTALLERPAPGGASAALALALRLLGLSDGRCLLVRCLAEPSADRVVRTWRTRLMESLHGHSPEAARAVLDIYETTMVHHRDVALAQVRRGFAVLSEPQALADRGRLEDTLSLGDWWGPLAALARADNEALRQRLYLGYEFPQGLELHRAVNRLRGALR